MKTMMIILKLSKPSLTLKLRLEKLKRKMLLKNHWNKKPSLEETSQNKKELQLMPNKIQRLISTQEKKRLTRKFLKILTQMIDKAEPENPLLKKENSKKEELDLEILELIRTNSKQEKQETKILLKKIMWKFRKIIANKQKL